MPNRVLSVPAPAAGPASYVLGPFERFALQAATWTQTTTSIVDYTVPQVRALSPEGETIAVVSAPAIFGNESLEDLITTTPGLAGFWKLDEAAGTTAADSSGLGLDLSSVGYGTPGWGAASPFPGITAPIFSQVPADALFRAAGFVGLVAGDFTAESWGQHPHGPPTGSEIQYLVGQNNPVGGGQGWALFLHAPGDGTLALQGFIRTGAGVAGLISDGSLPGSNWHHCVMRREAGTYQLILDGVVQSGSVAHGATANASLWVGAQVSSGGVLTHPSNALGRASYVAVYSAGLSDDTIAQHYDAGISGGEGVQYEVALGVGYASGTRPAALGLGGVVTGTLTPLDLGPGCTLVAGGYGVDGTERPSDSVSNLVFTVDGS